MARHPELRRSCRATHPSQDARPHRSVPRHRRVRGGRAGAPGPTVTFSWERDAPPTTFTSFRLKNLGDDSTVVVRCLTASGDRCKGALRKAFRAEGVSGTVEVKRFVGRRIRPGRRLEARITKSGWKTVYKTVTVKRSGPPTISTECSEQGSSERGPC